jgi:hypothetical protein
MYTGIRDWDRFLQQCYRHVKPGGWVEISSVHFTAKCDDETLPKDAAIVEMISDFDDIATKMGADIHYPARLKSLFHKEGFINIVETIFHIPSSPWMDDEQMKSIGTFEMVNIAEGAHGLMNRGWCSELRRSEEDLAMLVMRVKQELSSGKMHCYMPL